MLLLASICVDLVSTMLASSMISGRKAGLLTVVEEPGERHPCTLSQPPGTGVRWGGFYAWFHLCMWPGTQGPSSAKLK